jgi:hypothetical protein
MKGNVVCLAVGAAAAAASCASDLDCSLNGRCMGGACDCDAAWEGAQCERFSWLPTPAGADLKEPNVTTWGAGTLGRRVGGLLHMYAAEMVGGCGITTWLTNSQVVHYTADAPTGPWTREDVALPVWGHCPSAALTPNDTVVMWAFNAAGGRKPKEGDDAWGNACAGGASPCGFAKHGCGPNAPPAPSPPPPPPPPPSPPTPAPPAPPAPPVGGGLCSYFASAPGFTCRGHACLSDGARLPQHCGASDLCANGSSSPFCAPLAGCNSSASDAYGRCSLAAAARCRSDARCHGFALFKEYWRQGRAQFFAKGSAGAVAQDDWTAFTLDDSGEYGGGEAARAELPGPAWPRARPSHAEMLREGASTLPLLVSVAGPSGPWRAVYAEIEEPVSFSIAAPWFLPNGTAFFVLQTGCPYAIDNPGTCGTVVRAESWEGPYRVVARGACSVGEDHSMYVDARGAFHCITHRFSNATLPAGPYDARYDGGHAFSADGADPWFCADGRGGHGECSIHSPIAYNSSVVYEQDGEHRFGTRERPHVLFDGGQPVALTTSVQHCQPPGVPDACVAGDPRSCNQSNVPCKNNWPGYLDRAWTSVAPLRTAKPSAPRRAD